MTPDHSARSHALLSASSAHRWLNCTPSARLEEREPDTSSAYAAEGTLAHELCEMYLNGRESDADARFDSDMHAAALGYSDYVAEKSRIDTLRIVEERVDFSRYVPEGFGTCDCLLIDCDVLTVIDFKYGRGVKVDAPHNPQLMLYALGALEAYSFAYDFQTVNMCIYQPRVDNISEWSLPVSELYAWAENELKPKAAKAIRGEGVTNAGEHCRFCRYAAKCAALRDYCLKGFEIEDLTPEEVADILNREKTISAWLKSVHEYAFNALKQDANAIPGFKLVEGKTQRRYTDAAKVAEVLTAKGFTEAQIYAPRKLIGLTEMTKLLGKKRFNELLSDSIEKPQGAPTLAPENDKRPALATFDFEGEDEDVTDHS